MFKPIPELSKSERDRLELNIIRGSATECWSWFGNCHKRGYGTLRIKHEMFRVTRLVYKLEFGVDPGQHEVLHSCDNPNCCNPAHLSLGTHQDNMDDCFAKGRKVRYTADVADVLSLKEKGYVVKDIAYIIDCSRETVDRILRNERVQSRRKNLQRPSNP